MTRGPLEWHHEPSSHDPAEYEYADLLGVRFWVMRIRFELFSWRSWRRPKGRWHANAVTSEHWYIGEYFKTIEEAKAWCQQAADDALPAVILREGEVVS